MLRYLVIAYVGVYCLMAVAMFAAVALHVPTEKEPAGAWWETPLDVVMAVLGLVGMLLFLADYDPPALRNAWKAVSVALVAAQLYVNLKDAVAVRRGGDGYDKGVVRFSNVFTLAFLAPSLALNLLYAFG